MLLCACTVPTFNSCTKCKGSSGIIHDRTPDCHRFSWTWMTSQLNVALICKLRGKLMCLIYFWRDILGCLYNLALADVWSTGARIKCLYCTCINNSLWVNNGNIYISIPMLFATACPLKQVWINHSSLEGAITRPTLGITTLFQRLNRNRPTHAVGWRGHILSAIGSCFSANE